MNKLISLGRRIRQLHKNAFDYFNRIRICPTFDEIIDYITEAILDETGQNCYNELYHMIEEELK